MEFVSIVDDFDDPFSEEYFQVKEKRNWNTCFNQEKIKIFVEKLHKDPSYIQQIIKEEDLHLKVSNLELNWRNTYPEERFMKDSLVPNFLVLYPEIYPFLPESFKKSRDFNLQMIKECPFLFEYLDEIYQNDFQFIKTAIQKSNGRVIERFSKNLRDSEDVIFEFYLEEPENLDYASDRIKDNRPFIYRLLNTNPNGYPYISERLKEDANMLPFAIDKSLSNVELNENMSHIPSKILQDKKTILHLIQLNPKILPLLGFEFQKDKEIVLKAIETDPNLIDDVLSIFKNDIDIMMVILKKNPQLILSLSSKVLRDRELILLAIQNLKTTLILKKKEHRKNSSDYLNQDIFDVLPESLQNDYEILFNCLRKGTKSKMAFERSLFLYPSSNELKIASLDIFCNFHLNEYYQYSFLPSSIFSDKDNLSKYIEIEPKIEFFIKKYHEKIMKDSKFAMQPISDFENFLNEKDISIQAKISTVDEYVFQELNEEHENQLIEDLNPIDSYTKVKKDQKLFFETLKNQNQHQINCITIPKEILNERRLIIESIEINPFIFTYQVYNHYKNDQELLLYGFERNPRLYLHYKGGFLERNPFEDEEITINSDIALILSKKLCQLSKGHYYKNFPEIDKELYNRNRMEFLNIQFKFNDFK